MSEKKLRPVPGGPCRGCPWRKDTPPGMWPESVYRRLRAYDGNIAEQVDAGGQAPMFCHTEPAFLCGGWIACVDTTRSYALRRNSERVNWTMVWYYKPCSPVFATGAQAAEHGRKAAGGTDALVEDIVKAVVAWAGGTGKTPPDPRKLDDAARILSLSPHLGPLPEKAGDSALLRPRHCTVCGECPQFRAVDGSPWGVGCRCGHPVEKHSFVPYELEYYKERSRDHGKEPAAAA